MRKISILISIFILTVTLLVGGYYFKIIPPYHLLYNIPIEQKIGQMIMVGFKGTGISDNEPELELILKDIERGFVGGIIYFDRQYKGDYSAYNIVSMEQLKNLTNKLQQRAPIKLFIGIDQEGGKVQRLKKVHGMQESPSAYQLGLKSIENTYNIAYLMGKNISDININLNFAPCLDIDDKRCPAIGMLDRAFSSNPEEVGMYGNAFIDGLWKNKVIASGKHFPGHGSSRFDSHDGFVDVTDTWEKKELIPFIEAIKNPNLGMIMTGHIINKNYDTYPASLSYEITTNLLRKELKWNGVIITDDMEMGAISKNFTEDEAILLAISAGADILLFGNNINHKENHSKHIHETILRLIQEGKISEDRINESYKRIIMLKHNANILN